MGDHGQQGLGPQHPYTVQTNRQSPASTPSIAGRPPGAVAPQVYEVEGTSGMAAVGTLRPALASFPTTFEARTIYNPYPLRPAPLQPTSSSSSSQSFPNLSSGNAFPQGQSFSTVDSNYTYTSPSRHVGDLAAPTATTSQPQFKHTFLPPSSNPSSSYITTSSHLASTSSSANPWSTPAPNPRWQSASFTTAQTQNCNANEHSIANQASSGHTTPDKMLYSVPPTSLYVPQNAPPAQRPSALGETAPAQVYPLQSYGTGSSQSNLSSMAAVPSSSSSPAPFRYAGYSAPDFLVTDGQYGHSTGLERSSSMIMETRYTANTPRPSSEPVVAQTSRSLSVPSLASNLQTINPGMPSPYFTPCASPSQSLGQGELHYAVYWNDDLGIPPGSSSGHSASSQSQPASTSGNNAYVCAPVPQSQFSARSAASSPNLKTENNRHQASYSTRTRLNMQGLIHSDHVEEGFPGDWGGAFR